MEVNVSHPAHHYLRWSWWSVTIWRLS